MVDWQRYHIGNRMVVNQIRPSEIGRCCHCRFTFPMSTGFAMLKHIIVSVGNRYIVFLVDKYDIVMTVKEKVSEHFTYGEALGSLQKRKPQNENLHRVKLEK